jgi:hypothetical protein
MSVLARIVLYCMLFFNHFIIVRQNGCLNFLHMEQLLQMSPVFKSLSQLYPPKWGKVKGKNWCFGAMDVEKNFTSCLDREENKLFSFGRRETQKITWSDKPPSKVTLFWSRHESKMVTRTGHYAWTSLTLEAMKTTDAMPWQHQIKKRNWMEHLREAVQVTKKLAYAGGRKDTE